MISIRYGGPTNQSIAHKPSHAYLLLVSAILLLAYSPKAMPQIASRPPMGWNSWNHYGANVTDLDIRHAADAFAANGMREAGYEYVNIDDGWQGGRDERGRLVPNERFPDMRSLSDYVHGKGLKLGLYSSPGAKTCAGFEGGLGHESIDAETFASWKIDFLKYDICSYRKMLEETTPNDPDKAKGMMEDAFGRMAKALAAAGRPMVYSISQHGLSEVWKWGADVGANLWRTGDDIRNNYLSVTELGFQQSGLGSYASPTHWNDPDMLEIGNGGLSPDEARTQMSLWALLAAPLIAGNDLGAVTSDELAILVNSEVIAIDQDAAGMQGDRLWSQGPIEVWMRDLGDGGKAVGLFNRNAFSIRIPLAPNSLGWEQAEMVRDVWRHQDLPALKPETTFLVPSHGVILLILHQDGTGHPGVATVHSHE